MTAGRDGTARVFDADTGQRADDPHRSRGQGVAGGLQRRRAVDRDREQGRHGTHLGRRDREATPRSPAPGLGLPRRVHTRRAHARDRLRRRLGSGLGRAHGAAASCPAGRWWHGPDDRSRQPRAPRRNGNGRRRRPSLGHPHRKPASRARRAHRHRRSGRLRLGVAGSSPRAVRTVWPASGTRRPASSQSSFRRNRTSSLHWRSAPTAGSSPPLRAAASRGSGTGAARCCSTSVVTAPGSRPCPSVGTAGGFLRAALMARPACGT